MSRNFLLVSASRTIGNISGIGRKHKARSQARAPRTRRGLALPDCASLPPNAPITAPAAAVSSRRDARARDRTHLRQIDSQIGVAQGADSYSSACASPAAASSGGARAGRATGRSVGRPRCRSIRPITAAKHLRPDKSSNNSQHRRRSSGCVDLPLGCDDRIGPLPMVVLRHERLAVRV